MANQQQYNANKPPTYSEANTTTTTYFMPPPQQGAPPPATVQFSTAPPVGGRGTFVENDPRYMCCCVGQCIHSKMGTLIIAAFSLLEPIIIVITYLHVSLQMTSFSEMNVFAIGLAIGIVVVVAMLLYGVLKERHLFIAPFMVLQVLLVVLYVIVAGLSLLLLVGVFGSIEEEDSSSWKKDTPINISLLHAVFIVFSILTGCHIWWGIVALKCYRCLYDKNWVTRTGGGVQLTAAYAEQLLRTPQVQTAPA